MPECQHTMSVTVSGPLTRGPTGAPSSTSSHQRVSVPRGPSRPYCSSMAAISSSVYARISMRSSRFLSRALDRSVRTMQRYCADKRRSSSRKTCPVHSCTARSAKLLGLSSTPTSALRRQVRRPGRNGAHHSRALAA